MANLKYISSVAVIIQAESDFYQLLFLFIVLGLVIAGLIYYYIRARVSFLEKKQEILKKIVEDQTKELTLEKNELIRSLQKIQEQNQEKDVLIQEVHHRVKNNLQAISSIVEMQLMSVQNDQSRSVLTDTYRRIRAMSLVHERLHMADNMAKISAHEYLKVLINSINATVNLSRLPIKFKPRICRLNLSVSDCISLGMITSEAISNSIKYAFISQENPIIYIDLFHQTDRSWLTFRITDNGIGISDNYIQGKENSLGIRLIQIFSAQLKGELSISNEKGTKIQIDFKERGDAHSHL